MQPKWQLPLVFDRGHKFKPLTPGAARLPRSQLLLGLDQYDVQTFATHVAGANKEVVEVLLNIAAGDSHDNVYLWGGRGLGKTHLLLAVCNLAATSERPCAYIPLRRIDEFAPDLLSSLEQLSLVCLDDIDAVAGRADWETALFNLFNRLKEVGAPLIMSASQSPRAGRIRLPDLKSRLSWGLCYRLQALDERDNITALKQRARARGFELSDQVVEFLIRRVERDTRNLFDWLNRLDRHSLEAQRKLTVDFVKEILRGDRDEMQG